MADGARRGQVLTVQAPVVAGRVCSGAARAAGHAHLACRIPGCCPGRGPQAAAEATRIAQGDPSPGRVSEAVSWSEHQPNKRVKLAARFLQGRIPFVITKPVRRRLRGFALSARLLVCAGRSVGRGANKSLNRSANKRASQRGACVVTRFARARLIPPLYGSVLRQPCLKHLSCFWSFSSRVYRLFRRPGRMHWLEICLPCIRESRR